MSYCCCVAWASEVKTVLLSTATNSKILPALRNFILFLALRVASGTSYKVVRLHRRDVCRMGIGMLPSRLFFILSQTSTTIGSWRLAWRCDDDVYCDTVGSTILLSCNRWGSFIRVIGSESASAVRVERNSLSRAAPHHKAVANFPVGQPHNPIKSSILFFGPYDHFLGLFYPRSGFPIW